MKVETVAQQLLFATLRIETQRSVGTGFIVSHKWSEDRVGPFLVTNKHVVEGRREGRLTFTVADQSNENESPSLGKLTSINLSENAWKWTAHPSDDIDIAVLPLASAVNHLQGQGSTPFYRSIQTDLIAGKDVLEDLDAVEEILFIGYPSGVYDRVNNLPITRKGITATPLSVDYDGRPIFLIDASVFPGSSGSPVFLYNNDAGLLVGKPRIAFLGVLGGVLYHHADGMLRFEEIATASRAVVSTKEMIDLGVVFKATTVVETIEQLLRQRGELPPVAAPLG